MGSKLAEWQRYEEIILLFYFLDYQILKIILILTVLRKK